MSSTTPYLALTLYDSTTDQAVAFATFRAVWGGPATSSNFYKIDTGLFDLDARIDILESYRGAIPVAANYISANYYEATGITPITAYTSGMAIVLSLDTTSDGTVTLNINALGTKSLMKIDSAGTAINLTGSDLVKNRRALFVYDGTRWLWVSANSADQISIVGTAGNVVTVNTDNTLLGTLTQSLLISQTINSATDKDTPVDADKLGLVDSAASNVLKALSWLKLKATLWGFTTTATAAGTTTLTSSSTPTQEFTGSTTQTVTLPVVSTLYVGYKFKIINSSTGIVTVNSSGSNLIKAVQPSATLNLTCVLITGTTAASWSFDIEDPAGAINNAVAKTTPVDADRFGFWDSVSGLLNHVTWANIKATLLTYFNTIFPAKDGWMPVSDTWTYASATTITVPSGATSKYQIGDKFKLTANSVVLYGYIITVADTLLTVLGNPLTNHTFSSVNYSHVENPMGHPIWFDFTPTLSQGASTDIAKTIRFSRYSISGRQLRWIGRLFATAAGTAGSPFALSLPMTVYAPNAYPDGVGSFIDASPLNWYDCNVYVSTTTINFSASYQLGSYSGYMGAVPNIALANTDELEWSVQASI